MLDNDIDKSSRDDTKAQFRSPIPDALLRLDVDAEMDAERLPEVDGTDLCVCELGRSRKKIFHGVVYLPSCIMYT